MSLPNPQSELTEQLEEILSCEREQFEILLAEVIDSLYLEYKKDFCDYKNKTHKLGWFKENIKSLVHEKLNK